MVGIIRIQRKYTHQDKVIVPSKYYTAGFLFNSFILFLTTLLKKINFVFVLKYIYFVFYFLYDDIINKF